MKAPYVWGDSLTSFKKGLEALVEPDPRPSVSAVASGFGAGHGDLFIAVSYSDRDLQTNIVGDEDGSILTGIGYESKNFPFKLEFTLGMTSVSTSWWGDGKFGDEGNINLKLHKAVSPVFDNAVASIAVGASNVIGWGSTVEIPTNNYLSYSELMNVGTLGQYGLAYTIGYGSSVGRAETAGDFFGGVALGRSSLSTSISFIGEEIYLSGTYYPPWLSHIALTFTRADIFDSQASSRNILTLGISKKVK